MVELGEFLTEWWNLVNRNKLWLLYTINMYILSLHSSFLSILQIVYLL